MNKGHALSLSINRKDRGYPGGSANDIGLLKDGNYLVSTSKGLYQCDSTLSKFKYVPLLKDKESELLTSNLKVDKDGIAWIGSSGQGLFRYDPKTKKVKQYLNDPRDSTSLQPQCCSPYYMKTSRDAYGLAPGAEAYAF